MIDIRTSNHNDETNNKLLRNTENSRQKSSERIVKKYISYLQKVISFQVEKVS